MSIRDINCGTDVAKMIEYSRYGEEYIVYGFTYYKNDCLWYKVSNCCETVYRIIAMYRNQGIITSPVHIYVERTFVPSGTNYDVIQKIKIKLAKIMQSVYHLDFYKQLYSLQENLLRNNTANDVLMNLKKEYEGYFDKEKLSIFENLLNISWQNKHLNEEEYVYYQKWLAKNRGQMETDFSFKEKDRILFFGFSYMQQDGTIAYEINAHNIKLQKKKEEYECQGFFVAPIFEKTYYANSSERKKYRLVFSNELKLIYGEEYWKRIEDIYSKIEYKNQILFFDTVARMKVNGSMEENNVLNAYLTRWGVK